MSGYIDLNYISKIQPRLQQFKKKRDYLFNFRCPVCGDSKKSKTKARAYLYRVKNDMFFKCHNCSASHNLANLIKLVDRPLYDQYILERYKGSKPSNDAESLFDKFKTNTKERLKSSTPLQGLTPFSQIDDEHPAKQYLNNRKLPKEYFDRLYYCDRFQTYVNKVRPGTFDSLNKRYEHPRLIIPFYDVDNNYKELHSRINKIHKELTDEIEMSEKRLMCEIKTLNTNLDGRIGVFEKYRWIIIGAAIVVGLSMPQIIDILKVVS